MRVFFVLSLVAISASALVVKEFPVADNAESLQYFREWTTQHGKTYGSPLEFSKRYYIFLDNLKKAAMLNSERENSDSAVFGPTQFSDLTQKEFERTVLSSFKPAGNKLRQEKTLNITATNAPASFDWTETAGVVTPIRDQGHDGTCWAFAGLANVESLYGKSKGSQCEVLSPQALNDCDGYFNIMQGAVACGVKGATMPAFYIWVINEGGMMAEKDYEYCVGIDKCSPCAPPGYNVEACDGPWPIDPCNKDESCDARYDRSKFVPGVKVKDYFYLVQDEELLKEGLVEVGPLVAGIDATDMQQYTGGVLKPRFCNKRSLNHAVLLVGYGESQGQAFWKVKNSWGTRWGEDGFFRIQRNRGACGINAEVSTSVLG